jgi:hypothetical protein
MTPQERKELDKIIKQRDDREDKIKSELFWKLGWPEGILTSILCPGCNKTFQVKLFVKGMDRLYCSNTCNTRMKRQRLHVVRKIA